MQTLEAKHSQIQEYIDQIKNRSKHEYAISYYHNVIRNGLKEPDYRLFGSGSLSFMGAQAVRLKISQIMNGVN